jgi:hypothetical protein
MGQSRHTRQGRSLVHMEERGVLTIETALPSGPRSDEAVDEEDLRRKKKALSLLIAAMTQPSQLRVETIE